MAASTISSDIIHLYRVSDKTQLRHMQIDQLSPDSTTERSLVKDARYDIGPTCVTCANKVYVYYINLEGKLVELSHSIVNGKEVNMRFIDNGKSQITMLKAVKT